MTKSRRCHDILCPEFLDSSFIIPAFLDTLAAMKKFVCLISTLFVFFGADSTQAANDLPAGSANGSLTYDGATAEPKFAVGFVDQKDERKPVVLVISDQRLPVQMGERIRIMMMDRSKWSGVVFFVDKGGKFFAPTYT